MARTPPGTVANMVALCLNHHREAHHSTERDVIRAHLMTMLGRALGA